MVLKKGGGDEKLNVKRNFEWEENRKRRPRGAYGS